MEEIKFPFQILVKANSNENELYYSKEKEIYILKIKAKAQDNKANLEVIKSLSRLLKRRVRIVNGFKNKIKIMDVV